MNAPTQLALEGVPLPTTTILVGDALERLPEMPSESVHCIVTSPPYFGLRHYGHEAQLGLDDSPHRYVRRLVEIMREAPRAALRRHVLARHRRHVRRRSERRHEQERLTSGCDHEAARAAWEARPATNVAKPLGFAPAALCFCAHTASRDPSDHRIVITSIAHRDRVSERSDGLNGQRLA